MKSVRFPLYAAALLALFMCGRVYSQEPRTGPLKAPAEKSPGSATSAPASPLPMPAEEIIRRFAAKEAEFRLAREQYTFTQTVRVQEFDIAGRPGGEFRQTSDIVFTPDGGKRFEKVTFAPPVSLKLLILTKEDMQDLENVQPFILTTEDMPKYNVQLLGRERVDELDAFVFSVSPKQMEKGHRYFEGKIWVDETDMQIVKSYGKGVGVVGKKDREQQFPFFETYRENIDNQYWFPTYTHADDILHFPGGVNVRIKMTIRYSNYKRFAVTTKIIGAEPVKPPQN